MSFNNDVRSDCESRTDSTVVTTNSIVVTKGFKLAPIEVINDFSGTSSDQYTRLDDCVGPNRPLVHAIASMSRYLHKSITVSKE